MTTKSSPYYTGNWIHDRDNIPRGRGSGSHQFSQTRKEETSLNSLRNSIISTRVKYWTPAETKGRDLPLQINEFDVAKNRWRGDMIDLIPKATATRTC